MPPAPLQPDRPSSRRVTFQIERFKAGVIDPPRHQSFPLEVNGETTVLDGLERIRLTLDATLLYRHSCHHSSCGTCACVVNGTERLACTTRVLDLDRDTVVLEPLRGFPRIGDLAVDMTGFYRDIDPDWAVLRPAEPVAGARRSEAEPPVRLEDCIECGCCVSSCPAFESHPEFMGPAALAAVHNEMRKRPDRAPLLLSAAASPRGERLCERALNCSRVCPTQVYPARHIADLRRLAAGAKDDPQETK
jgi:succinate dehydrogenase / fumarate reductase iron-sulfur subunit